MSARAKMLRADAGLDPSAETHVCAPPHFDGGCALDKEGQCTALGKSGGCEELMCMGMQPGEGYLVRGSKEGGSFEGCRQLALGTALASFMVEQWAPPMLPAMAIYATQWMQRRPQHAGVARRRYLTLAPPPWFTAEQLATAAERACTLPAHSLARESDGGDGWRALLGEDLNEGAYLIIYGGAGNRVMRVPTHTHRLSRGRG
jgi:hypothetical protein